MQKVRVIELPEGRSVYSGSLENPAVFRNFVGWFSAYHASLKCELCPRDFMRFNERKGYMEWFYVLPENAEAPDCGFETVPFSGGLYAVAPCLDGDFDGGADWEATREELRKWVNESSLFKLWENREGRPERYPMFRIVSPGRMYHSGISIEDLYVPIEEK